MKKLLFVLVSALVLNASAVYTQVSGFVDEISPGYSAGNCTRINFAGDTTLKSGNLYKSYVIDVNKLGVSDTSSKGVLNWVISNYSREWNALDSGSAPFNDMSAVVATLTYTDTDTARDAVGLGNDSANIISSDAEHNLYLVTLVSYNYHAYAHVGENTYAVNGVNGTLQFDDGDMSETWDTATGYGYGDANSGGENKGYDYWYNLGRGIPEPSSALLLLLGLTGLALKRKAA